MQRDVVIIGAGMAGTRLAQNLVSKGFSGQITLIGAEPDAGYNRILLSPVLSGEKAFEDTLLAAPQWYETHQIELLTNQTVTQIDTEHKTLSFADGQTLQYNSLVIATGSKPFIIPFAGHQASGVMAFRTRSDVEEMLQRVEQGSGQVAIIGGGLLGLEAASALARRGAKVTVVHNSDYVLGLQLDEASARIIEGHLAAMGVEFRLSANTQEVLEQDGKVCGLRFENQDDLDVDTVIMATGVRPDTELAKAAGLDVNRGILVDAQMHTSVDDVFALGECTEFEGGCFGMVAPVYDQADVLSDVIMQNPADFAPKPLATKLKVTGVDLFSAGDIKDNDDYDIGVYHDPIDHIYRRLSFRDNRLVGAILIGDVSDGGFLFDLIQSQQDLSGVRDQILYGQHYCQFDQQNPTEAEASTIA